MDKYLVIQKTSIEKFQASINAVHADGYNLTQFQVVSDAGDAVAFFGVMEKREPTRVHVDALVKH